VPITDSLSKNLVYTDYTANRLDIYRQAARDVAARNSGLERYVIGIFGPDLIGSLALAIDPYKQFQNIVSTVCHLTDGPKIVRTRSVLTQPRQNRRELWTSTVGVAGYHHDPDGGLFDYIWDDMEFTTTSGTRNRAQQEPLYGTIRDMTKATRPIKKDQGEFELFIPKIRASSFSRAYLKTDDYRYLSFPDSQGQRSHSKTWVRSRVEGPEFAVTNASVQTLLPGIRARALAAMLKNVYGMLDRVQPNHRTYSLFYQIAELRELPLTLRGTLKIWQDFERIVGTDYFRSLLRSRHLWRDPLLLARYAEHLGHFIGFNYNALRNLDEMAGSAFLTFKFGWESMYRAVIDLLPSVGQATLDVNRLIRQIGRVHSRRTKKTWSEPEASFPTFFDFVPLRTELFDSSTIRKEGTRECELRLMVNCTLNYPLLDVPRLRRELVVEKLGVVPAPSDVYNLIPWTWILDWFGGLGDYLSLMDSISNNDMLINFGFITYKEVSTCTATVAGRFETVVKKNIDFIEETTTSSTRHQHESIFTYKYQLRRSIPSLTNVREYWGSNLNANQTAIMGALASVKGGSLARRDVS